MNKKLLQFTSAAIFTFFILIAIGSGNETQNASNDSVSTESTNNADTPTSPIAESKEPNWQYSDSKDEMEGTTSYFATTTSTNQVDFDFPYDGGSTMDLTLRNMGQGNEVVITISKGQFMTSISDDETIKLKFDDGKPFSVSYNSANDGSSNVIFPNQSKKIISKIRNSKKLMIEASFFNSGRKIFNFELDGLDWKH
jgi:hypothetical protein